MLSTAAAKKYRKQQYRHIIVGADDVEKQQYRHVIVGADDVDDTDQNFL